METVSIVVFITLSFAGANLFFQLMAVELARRDAQLVPVVRPVIPEHPFSSRVVGMPRTRTDRYDLQRAMGHDFAAPDVQEHIWPPDPRYFDVSPGASHHDRSS